MSKKNEQPAVPAVPEQTNRALAMPFDYGTDAGEGMDLGIEDLLIPFVGLLQQLSPACDKTDDAYIPGAEPGKIINRATKELLDHLDLVPAVRRRTYVEYTPETPRKFVSEHETNSPVVKALLESGMKRNELKLPNGNLLVETFTMFAIQLNPEGNPIGFLVVPFSSTKIQAWRQYWTTIDTARVAKQAPLFAHTLRLGVKSAKNAKGKFFNFDMKPLKGGVLESMIAPTSAAYQAARDLRDAISTGRAKVDHAQNQDEAAATGDGGDSHF